MKPAALLFLATFGLAHGANTLFSDVDYVGKGNAGQTLDLLAPGPKAEKKLPLVVFIHGGGWEAGNKSEGTDIIRFLSSTNEYAAATINYRLSKEATWPAQIYDCKAAIRFLRGKANDYGIDPNKIGVFGMSAGGHLVAMLGTCGSEKSMEGDLGSFPTESSRVQCVVDFFGPTDLLTIRNGPATESPIAKLFGGITPDLADKAKLASPVTYVTKDAAPFFIAHGTKDPIVPFEQSTEIDNLMEKAGVPCELVPMTDAGHGFNNDTLNRRVKQFLDKYLLGRPAEISNEAIPAH